MSLAKALTLFSLLLSAAALATPHLYNGHHRAVAARFPHPEPIPFSGSGDLVTPRKRSLGKRCKPRTPPSSSSVAASTPTPQHGALATTSHSHVPTTTTQAATHKTTTTTTPPPQPTQPSSNEPYYMTGTQTGDVTFYSTGLGACGITNNDSDYICAVSHLMFDSFPGYEGGNPNNNPICGRQIVATYQGKSVTVTVIDRCAACKETDLDMSPTAFDGLADPSLGRLHGVTWVWK